MSKRDLIGRIKETMGAEAAMAFMEAVNALDLDPESPELVLAAANASFVVRLADLRRSMDEAVERFEASKARFLQDVDLKIAEGFVKALDESHTEVRTMARELAHGEYTAAASLRSKAINDEVRALRSATDDLARERQAAEAHGIASGAPAGVTEAHGSARAPGPAGPLGPRLFALIAVALVIGVFLGAWMTKSTYAGWRPPARTAMASPTIRRA
jgi:hypothetical protein